MNVIDCEKIQVAAMAASDGEEPKISDHEIISHIATCENCRNQREQLRLIDQMFRKQTRREQDFDLWPAIQKEIGLQDGSSGSWQPFALIALLLATYKLFEMLADQVPALLLNLVPLVLMIGLFAFIKENPFRINSEIMLER